MQKTFRIIFFYVYGHHGPAKLTHKVNNYKYVVLKSVLSIEKKKDPREKEYTFISHLRQSTNYPPYVGLDIPAVYLGSVCGMFMCVYTSF